MSFWSQIYVDFIIFEIKLEECKLRFFFFFFLETSYKELCVMGIRYHRIFVTLAAAWATTLFHILSLRKANQILTKKICHFVIISLKLMYNLNHFRIQKEDLFYFSVCEIFLPLSGSKYSQNFKLQALHKSSCLNKKLQVLSVYLDEAYIFLGKIVWKGTSGLL